MRPGGVNDVMHWKHARRIWGIWEKSVSWVLAPEDGWLSELSEALLKGNKKFHTWTKKS